MKTTILEISSNFHHISSVKHVRVAKDWRTAYGYWTDALSASQLRDVRRWACSSRDCQCGGIDRLVARDMAKEA